MSRSYRKPYSTVWGNSSAKWDKTQAHRGQRRAQNAAIRNVIDWDEFILPHRLECHHNDPWGWTRDGLQSLRLPPNEAEELNGPFAERWGIEEALDWYNKQKEWYAQLCRK